MAMKFRDLPVGEWFDFVGGDHPSFFLRCQKRSERTYRDEKFVIHRIGSINAAVYNVGRASNV
jgi:hypothetical protein